MSQLPASLVHDSESDWAFITCKWEEHNYSMDLLWEIKLDDIVIAFIMLIK